MRDGDRPHRGRPRAFGDPAEVVREVAELRARGFTWKVIAECYGVERTTLWRALHAEGDFCNKKPDFCNITALARRGATGV